jgi:dihydrofolate reductase
MAKVTCSMSTSLDGFIVGPDGGFDWSAPDEALFAYATDEVRALGVHLLGRRLYEAMSYWETPEAVDASRSELEREFGRLWRALPKVVFSTTLTAVEGTNVRLADGSVADEVARWRSRLGIGNIAVGGAGLLAAVAAAGLIDEYRVRVYPVLVGGGTPLFPQAEQRIDLELVSVRTFDCGVVAMHHRVIR